MGSGRHAHQKAEAVEHADARGEASGSGTADPRGRDAGRRRTAVPCQPRGRSQVVGSVPGGWTGGAALAPAYGAAAAGVSITAASSVAQSAAAWSGGAWVLDGHLDVVACRRGDRARVLRPVLGRPHLAPARRAAWMELPEARTPGSRARRARGATVAPRGVAADQKNACKRRGAVAFLDE